MHHLTAERVGAKLRARRISLHMTQQDVSDQTTTTKPQLSRIENGQVMPRIETLDALCAAMGWTLQQFFRGLT